MGCLFSLPETNLIQDEIVYTYGVDFYIENTYDENEMNILFFLCD
jgi:hypothetical protein